MTPRLISLAHLSMLDADPFDLADAAASAGFGAVGIRMRGNAVTPMKLDVTAAPGTAREIAAHNRRLGISVLDVEGFQVSATMDRDWTQRALEAAGTLGARFVLSVCNDEDRAAWLDGFSWFAETARSFEIVAGLEFIPYVRARTIADVTALLDAAGSDNTGIILDCLHLSRSGGSPEDLRRVGVDRIAYAQVCDARAERPETVEGLTYEARHDRLAPGEGTLWLPEVLDILPHDLPLSIEAPVASLKELPYAQRASNLYQSLAKLLHVAR